MSQKNFSFCWEKTFQQSSHLIYHHWNAVCLRFASFLSIQYTSRYGFICEELWNQVCRTAPRSGVETSGRKDSPTTSPGTGKLLWLMRLDRNTLRGSGPASSDHMMLTESRGNEHLILTGITSVVWVQSALRFPLIFMLSSSERAVRKGCLLLHPQLNTGSLGRECLCSITHHLILLASCGVFNPVVQGIIKSFA